MERVIQIQAVTFAAKTPKGVVDVTFTRNKIVVTHDGKTKKMSRDPSDCTLPNQTRARKVVEHFLRGRHGARA